MAQSVQNNAVIAIDTNILLRYLLKDDLAQAEKAERLIKEAIAHGSGVFINRLVLCETVWVLHQSYRLPKAEVVHILEILLEVQGFTIDAEEIVWEALEAYRTHNLNFSDAFIAAGNCHAGVAHTFTLDKKAARLAGFKLLT